jgi:hypothetical protein
MSRANLGAIVILAMLMAPRPAVAAGKDRVSIVILPAPQNTYRVSVLFPAEVGKKRGAAEVNDLWRRAGWKPWKAEWVISPAFRKFPKQMSVEFTVDSLYPKGQFPVEAIALAFKSWGGVDVSAATSVSLPPGSKPHYEDADAVVDIATGANALSVTVLIKNPKMERLGMAPLPTPAPVSAPLPVKRYASTPVWAFVLVAVGAAGVAWIVVFVLMSAWREPVAKGGPGQ